MKIYSDTEPKKITNSDGNIDEVKPAYKIKYTGDDRGVSWVIWFCNFSTGFKYYGIEAIINPKILVKIKDYISTSNDSYLERIVIEYNKLVAQISDDIPPFSLYSIRRIDYCVNFDLSEMGCDCLPEQMMKLIKRGDI